MRFDITFNLNPLRALKPLLTIISKVGFASKQSTRAVLIYFSKQKQIRLLIHNSQVSIILALQPNLISVNRSQFKEQDFIIFSIAFVNCDQFVDCLLQIIDKQKVQKLQIALSKEKATNDQFYRFLTMTCHRTKLKLQIDKPEYDPYEIVNHPWINGTENKKVIFSIDFQPIVKMLKIFNKFKELGHSEKYITLQLNFDQKELKCSMETARHLCEGQILWHQFDQQKFEGNYVFKLQTAYSRELVECFNRVGDVKLIITKDNAVVIAYSKEVVYQCQILISTWMKLDSFMPSHDRQPKVEHM